MKVYVVLWNDWEDDVVEGVFSTYQSAEDLRNKFGPVRKNYTIEEWEVDGERLSVNQHTPRRHS